MTDLPVASWIVWALLSAVFAALTAIFAKVGVENINSDLATFIRTVIILFVLGGLLAARGLFQPLGSISLRTYLFLALSGCATGASWVCYFRALQLGDAARVAPNATVSECSAWRDGHERETDPSWPVPITLSMQAPALPYLPRALANLHESSR
jgi:uncharacterized membrane protein